MRPFRKSLLILFSIAFISGCETNEPEDNAQLKITVEETSCTEAWVKVEYTSGFRISLQRNGTEIANFKLTGNDTTIIDEALEPSRTYSYTADVTVFDGHLKTETSARTLDTTNYSFEWTTYIFGTNSSSMLNNVVVFDSKNILTCGEIAIEGTNIDDSLGNFIPSHNIGRWDGERWKFQTIYYKDFWGGNVRGMFAFDSNDIWFGSYHHYYNKNFRTIPLPGEVMTSFPRSMWGIKDEFMYFIDGVGEIGKYSNGKWIKITYGKDEYMYDIWGARDNITGKDLIVCATDSDLRLINSDNTTTVIEIPIRQYNYIGTIWFMNNNILYAAGTGVYTYVQNEWEKILGGDEVYNRIRGRGHNEIYAVGTGGTVSYFNGKNWTKMHDEYGSIYRDVSIGDDLIVAVGWIGNQAIIRMGKKK